MNDKEFEQLVTDWLKKWLSDAGKPPSPSALVTAFGLVERLRVHGNLELGEHKNRSDGLVEHDKSVESACRRFDIDILRLRQQLDALGRRSNGVGHWGPSLINLLGTAKIAVPDSTTDSRLHRLLHSRLAAEVERLLLRDPIRPFQPGRKLESAVALALMEAKARDCADDVAQYLVAAKLSLRFGRPIGEFYRSNTPDRTADGERIGDIAIGTLVFEVAAGPPDEKHVQQVLRHGKNPAIDLWLLVRKELLLKWEAQLIKGGVDLSTHVTVASIEQFVAQNIDEMGGKEKADRHKVTQQLVDRYNQIAHAAHTKIEGPGAA